jgi:hypothetical protein
MCSDTPIAIPPMTCCASKVTKVTKRLSHQLVNLWTTLMRRRSSRRCRRRFREARGNYCAEIARSGGTNAFVRRVAGLDAAICNATGAPAIKSMRSIIDPGRLRWQWYRAQKTRNRRPRRSGQVFGCLARQTASQNPRKRNSLLGREC